MRPLLVPKPYASEFRPEQIAPTPLVWLARRSTVPKSRDEREVWAEIGTRP